MLHKQPECGLRSACVYGLHHSSSCIERCECETLDCTDDYKARHPLILMSACVASNRGAGIQRLLDGTAMKLICQSNRADGWQSWNVVHVSTNIRAHSTHLRPEARLCFALVAISEIS